MDLRDHLLRLTRYNGWANARILAAAHRVLPEQPVYGEDYGVLPDALLHLLNAEETWLTRWLGEPDRETVNPSWDQLVAAFARSRDGLESFVSALSQADLDRTFTRTARDYELSAPLSDFVAHLMHHGTYHRGEIALLLTQQGASPGDIDYYDLLLEEQPEADTPRT